MAEVGPAGVRRAAVPAAHLVNVLREEHQDGGGCVRTRWGFEFLPSARHGGGVRRSGGRRTVGRFGAFCFLHSRLISFSGTDRKVHPALRAKRGFPGYVHQVRAFVGTSSRASALAVLCVRSSWPSLVKTSLKHQRRTCALLRSRRFPVLLWQEGDSRSPVRKPQKKKPPGDVVKVNRRVSREERGGAPR